MGSTRVSKTAVRDEDAQLMLESSVKALVHRARSALAERMGEEGMAS